VRQKPLVSHDDRPGVGWRGWRRLWRNRGGCGNRDCRIWGLSAWEADTRRKARSQVGHLRVTSLFREGERVLYLRSVSGGGAKRRISCSIGYRPKLVISRCQGKSSPRQVAFAWRRAAACSVNSWSTDADSVWLSASLIKRSTCSSLMYSPRNSSSDSW